MDTEHKWCWEQGARCVDLVCDHPDGKKLAAIVHFRYKLEVESHRGEIIETLEGDRALIAIEGHARIGSFELTKDELDALPVMTPSE